MNLGWYFLKKNTKGKVQNIYSDDNTKGNFKKTIQYIFTLYMDSKYITTMLEGIYVKFKMLLNVRLEREEMG